MFKGKRGFIGMWGDVFKGLFFGSIITAVVLVLMLVLKVFPVLNTLICGCK